MKTFTNILGFLIIAVAICAALYLGLYVCFIGGIVMIIDQIKAPHTEALMVLLGFVRIFSASLVGWATFMLGGAAGGYFLSNK